MEHLFIQKSKLELEALYRALTETFPNVEFSLSGANLSGKVKEFGVFRISSRGRIPKPQSVPCPSQLDGQICLDLFLAAVCSKVTETCLCWFDDDIGSAFAIFSKGAITEFRGESEDYLFALRGEKIDVTDRALSDESPPIYVFAVLDAGLSEFLGTVDYAYETVSKQYHESPNRVSWPSKEAPSVAGSHPVLRLWTRYEDIFNADTFVHLVSATRESNSADKTAALALDFLKHPSCKKPGTSSQALALSGATSLSESIELLISDPVRPGDWVLALAYSHPTPSELRSLLKKGRPYSFVALETIEYLMSRGQRPEKLGLVPAVREFIQRHPLKFSFTQVAKTEIKKAVMEFAAESNPGLRERKSIEFCLKCL
ncbi:MAG: hypothetical protein K1X75_13100 [Leptospirales bacterium]|nr:hypothetical protein [Leptospirales bacterium]